MDLAILERISYFFKKGAPVTLSQFLEEGVISFLEATHRDEALKFLVDELKRAHKIEDSKLFLNALLKREKIVSTGIGMGVAIPHARMETFDHFFLAVGIQKAKKGIQWCALDGSLVKIIFMIGGPADKQTEYLQFLSRLTTALKDEKRRIELLKAKSSEEVITLFRDV